MTQGIVFQSSIEHKNYSFSTNTLSTTTIAHNSVLQTLGKICSQYVYENSAMESNLLNSASVSYMTHTFISIF